MNIRAQIFVLIATMGFLLPSFAQEEPSRLLPESFTRSIKFSWSQDGRVLDIELLNPKEKWVITDLLVEVYFPVEGRFQPDPVFHTVILELQPGKSTTAHLELSSNTKASGLALLETRGHEQTRIERVKNAIW